MDLNMHRGSNGYENEQSIVSYQVDSQGIPNDAPSPNEYQYENSNQKNDYQYQTEGKEESDRVMPTEEKPDLSSSTLTDIYLECNFKHFPFIILKYTCTSTSSLQSILNLRGFTLLLSNKLVPFSITQQEFLEWPAYVEGLVVYRLAVAKVKIGPSNREALGKIQCQICGKPVESPFSCLLNRFPKAVVEWASPFEQVAIKFSQGKTFCFENLVQKGTLQVCHSGRIISHTSLDPSQPLVEVSLPPLLTDDYAFVSYEAQIVGVIGLFASTKPPDILVDAQDSCEGVLTIKVQEKHCILNYRPFIGQHNTEKLHVAIQDSSGHFIKLADPAVNPVGIVEMKIDISKAKRFLGYGRFLVWRPQRGAIYAKTTWLEFPLLEAEPLLCSQVELGPKRLGALLRATVATSKDYANLILNAQLDYDRFKKMTHKDDWKAIGVSAIGDAIKLAKFASQWDPFERCKTRE